MSRKLPPLNQLKTFESAGRTLSFKDAADELFVTPSAVSHQVKSLEEFLGFELFERKTRRILLTAGGREYLQSVQKALTLLEHATERLINHHSSGELKLAVAPAFLDRWLLPRLSSFTDIFPDIELDITSQMGILNFHQSDIDMAVYFGDGSWPDIHCVHLKTSSLVPVCSPKLVPENGFETADQLMSQRLLHVKRRPNEWRDWFQYTGETLEENKRGVYLSSGMLASRAAAKGMGLALTDLSLVTEELKSGELVVAFEQPLPLPKSFWLVYQFDRELTPAMTAFSHWIIREMEKDMNAEPIMTGPTDASLSAD